MTNVHLNIHFISYGHFGWVATAERHLEQVKTTIAEELPSHSNGDGFEQIENYYVCEQLIETILFLFPSVRCHSSRFEHKHRIIDKFFAEN